MSKKRNKRNAKPNGRMRGGAMKFATIKPTISSITITGGSVPAKIFAAPVDSHMAQQIAAARVATAIGKETEASAFKPRDRGTATSGPAVPGSRGRYRAPKPVARNSVVLGKIPLGWRASGGIDSNSTGEA